MNDAELEALAELEGVPVDWLRETMAPAPESAAPAPRAAPAPDAPPAPINRDGVHVYGDSCATVSAAPQRRDPLGLLGMRGRPRRVGL